MASLFDTTRNFSFYAPPAAWLLAFIPHAIAASLSKTFDNRSPRTYVKSLEADQTIDKATKDLIIRCEGAQSNGFENLGLFAAAVVAGNVAGLPAQTLNTLCALYLATRVVYTGLYITNTSAVMAGARSVVFTTGVGLCCTLFVKSGNAVREGGL
ncbi:hypothetical protein LCER1_G005717 [Lachnellula cervina]|uniref:Microsomal glutathione S-transferase 3 n=1 Tax=Lachnellula cervina TaxID=1316786 RepID=A0A7D8YVD2_9HELO|nr:hypothetical protein LCER1_G005717 [Lachnellula cervina]